MKLLFLTLFIFGCNSEPKNTNPHFDCTSKKKCGPDAICASDESCYEVPGCEKTLCLKKETACQTACGQESCEIMESYPAQISCKSK